MKQIQCICSAQMKKIQCTLNNEITVFNLVADVQYVCMEE
jgi:hypothetical protein